MAFIAQLRVKAPSLFKDAWKAQELALHFDTRNVAVDQNKLFLFTE